jgi:hypothetical protein
MQNISQVNALGFPMINGFLGIKHIDTADHVFKFPKPKLSHDLTHFLGDKGKEINHIFGPALQISYEVQDLGWRPPQNTCSNGICAAQNTAHGNQGRGGKPEFIGA